MILQIVEQPKYYQPLTAPPLNTLFAARKLRQTDKPERISSRFRRLCVFTRYDQVYVRGLFIFDKDTSFAGVRPIWLA